MSRATDVGWALPVRRALLRWYDRERRDLPWRRTRDPYAIWLSETMLQQTRVETVIPYYERFLERFPTVQVLADADPESVYEAWTGLGYYSRARNLQAAARRVVEQHAGALPDDAETLRGLPGVGRYTAGAVASIAFDRPEPVVDGNVTRVLARLRGIREDVSGAAVVRRLWADAALLARSRRPGDLNQALMELGARVCTPRSPRCASCPLAGRCDARAAGDAAELPRKERKTRVRPLSASAAWLVRRSRVLVVRRPEGGLLGGLWELPGGDLEQDEPPARGLRRALRTRVGLSAGDLRPLGAVEHLFSHRHLTLHVFACPSARGRVRLDGPAEHRWLTPDRLPELAQGAPLAKARALAEGGAPERVRARPVAP